MPSGLSEIAEDAWGDEEATVLGRVDSPSARPSSPEADQQIALESNRDARC